MPSGIWEDTGYKATIEQLLGLPQGYELTTILLMGAQEGYPDVTLPERQRREDFSWLHRNRFGAAP